jgi:hypothetical protein
MSDESKESIDPRYPVGKFAWPESIGEADRAHAITALAGMPGHLRTALAGLAPAQLDTPYREGGWTVRQLVHHIADSHTNAVIRIRKALTEDWPVISAYDEKAWAMLPDNAAPVEWSLGLIENLHARWVMLLGSLAAGDWQRGIKHPERGPMSVETATLLYAWHARHHVAHITELRARQGW